MPAKKKPGYTGGQTTIVSALKSNMKETIETKDGNYSFEPISELKFFPDENMVVGEGTCGDGCYVATCKEDAQAIIDFLKACYGIK